MWRIGEQVVYIQGHPGIYDPQEPNHPLRIGQLCVVTGYGFKGNCEVHGRVTGVRVAESKGWCYCPGCFRKPIDLDKYLSVNTTKKVKQDA